MHLGTRRCAVPLKPRLLLKVQAVHCLRAKACTEHARRTVHWGGRTAQDPVTTRSPAVYCHVTPPGKSSGVSLSSTQDTDSAGASSKCSLTYVSLASRARTGWGASTVIYRADASSVSINASNSPDGRMSRPSQMPGSPRRTVGLSPWLPKWSICTVPSSRRNCISKGG